MNETPTEHNSGPSPSLPVPPPEDLAVFEATGISKQSPMVGRVLAERYEILSELGRGGMGVVYLAMDRRQNQSVALKMLMGSAARSPDMRLRFQREAETASRLSHPGICGVLDFGEYEGLPFLVMDFVKGTTLDAVIEKAKAAADPGHPELPQDDPAATLIIKPKTGTQRTLLPKSQESDRTSAVAVDHMVKLLEKAARAVHAAHELGLIHRDIKPANLMVTPAGNPVLLDFGLARDLSAQGQTLTESGQIVGTPAYLAPEQVRGDRAAIDRRTDIYALGVTLYECLTLERPLHGETRDQLFHDILVGNWVSPRRRNPRIPVDLEIIVQKAMDRDIRRRYATAAELADDLKRVAAYEPIRAKRLSLWVRGQRWTGKHPAKASVLAASIIITLAGGGFALQQMITRAQALADRHLDAESQLQAGRFDAALEALAQARDAGLDPSEDFALRTRIEAARRDADEHARKLRDREAALAAIAEAKSLETRHDELAARVQLLRETLDRERRTVFSAAATDAERGAFAQRESALLELEAQAEEDLRRAYEALERAARLDAPWGPMTAATQEAFASHFLGRWRAATAAGDDLRAARFRADVERFDPEGRHRHGLSGEATLRIQSAIAGAELFLFRYGAYERIRPDNPVPRLVPVPTLGPRESSTDRIGSHFHAGDPALVITGVTPGSRAEREGLMVSDLVVAIGGEPAQDRALIREIAAESGLPDLESWRIRSIVELNGIPIETRFDWLMAPPAEEGKKDIIRVRDFPGALEVERRHVAVASARRIVESPVTASLTIHVLRSGQPLELTLAAGEVLGVQCELSAYPLVVAAGNRLSLNEILRVEPGSYLAVARAPGRTPTRFPVHLPHGGEAQFELYLPPEGGIPRGFVFIPGGEFRFGGDPEAVHPILGESRPLPPFLIARFEVTNQEWFEFLNDPAIFANLSADGNRRLIPREQTQLLAELTEDGKAWTWKAGSKDTPVMGVSWNDVQTYLEWRNARALKDGFPWTYDLPTQEEWEKAARGVDGRRFPWGNRFDFSLTVSAHRKRGFLHEAPAGFEPADESPYGVRDLAGSRQEWTKSRFAASDPLAPPAYHLRGGAWGSAISSVFRAAGQGYSDANYVGGSTGFRLVLRPRP